MIGLCQKCWASGVILSLSKKAEPLCERCYEVELNKND